MLKHERAFAQANHDRFEAMASQLIEIRALTETFEPRR